jgi:hypothetical protein
MLTDYPVKLGLADPVPGAVALRFGSYINWREAPTPPDHFTGHTEMVGHWGMLGNGAAPDNPPGLPNGAGNCAIAGPCHQIMKATAEGGTMAPFDTAAALTNYTAFTGFALTQPDGSPWPIDPFTGEPDNPTDAGTNIDDMAKQWRTNGLVDAAGAIHQIVAYVDLNPGDVRELWLAAWIFPLGVGCGYALPESALEQAADGQIWDVVPGSRIAGGHYVPTVARPAASLGAGVTWNRLQPFTARWHQAYNNQGIVPLSSEGLVKAKTLEGFDLATLADDLKEITRV